MAEVIGSAILEIGTDDSKLRRGLDDAEKSSRKGLASLKAVALGVGAAGVTAAAAFGAAMLKSGAEVEKAFAEVRTLLPQIGDEAFGAMQADVLALGKEMNVTTSELVPALYQAISGGVPPGNVIDFMKIASEAAVGGVTDLETAVDGISSVVNAYGEEAVSAQKASDLMFTAVRLGKTDMDQLSRFLFQVNPVAASLGVKFEEVTAAMAAMTAQGVPTRVATTSLRQLLTEASKSGTDLSDSIMELTGHSMPDLISDGHNVSWVLDELRRSMPDQQFRDLFSSVEAANAALQITGPNAEAMAANLKEMGDATGATNKAFETMADTSMFKVQRAFNAIKTTIAEWGMSLLDVLVPAVESVNNWIQSFVVEVYKIFNIPEDIPFFTALGRIVNTVVGPALAAVRGWFTDNQTTLANLGKAYKTTFGAIGNLIKSFASLVTTFWGGIASLFNEFAVWVGAESGGALIGAFFTGLIELVTLGVGGIGALVDVIANFTDGVNNLLSGEGFKGFWKGLVGGNEKTELDETKTSVSELATAIDGVNKPGAPTEGQETPLQKAKREVQETVSEFAKLPPETRKVSQEFSRLPDGAKRAIGALSTLGTDAAGSAESLRMLDADAKASALAFLDLPAPVQATARKFFELKPEAQAVAINLAGAGGGALIAIAALQGLDAPTKKVVTEFANLTPEAQLAAVTLQSMAPDTREAVLALSELSPEAQASVLALQGLPPEAQKSETALRNVSPEAKAAGKAFLDLEPEVRQAVIAFMDMPPEARAAALELEGTDAATKAAVLNFAALPPEVRAVAESFLGLSPEAQKAAVEFAALNPEMQKTVLETGALPPEAREAALALAELGPTARADTLELLGLSEAERASADEFLNLTPQARNAALALEDMSPKGRAVVHTLADLEPEARASAAALLDMDPDARKAELALADMDPTVRAAAMALGDTALEASDLGSELGTLATEAETQKPKLFGLFSPPWWVTAALGLGATGLALAGIDIPAVGKDSEDAQPKVVSFLGKIGANLETSPVTGIKAVGLVLSTLAGNTKETGDESETAEPKVNSLWETLGVWITEKLAGWQTKLDNFKLSLLFSALAGGLWLLGQYNSVKQWFSDTTTAFNEEITAWWEGLKTSWSEQWESWMTSIDENLTSLKTKWSEAWDATKERVATWWTNLKTDWTEQWDLWMQGIGISLLLLKFSWENTWANIKQAIADWWIALKEEYGIESTGFQSGIDLAMVLIKLAWENAWDAISQKVKDIWADIKSWVADGINDVIAKINGMIGKINEAIGSWNAETFNVGGFSHTFNPISAAGVQIWGGTTIGWGGVDIPTPDLPTIPTIPEVTDLAEGGIVEAVPGGVVARLAEAGQSEAVIPLDDPRAGRMLGGGGQTTNLYVETLYGWTNLEEVLAEAGVNVQIGGARNSFAGI